MKPRALIIPCLLILGPAIEEAQPPAPMPPPASSSVKTEILRLIRQDAAARELDRPSKKEKPSEPADDEALWLEPFIVRAKRLLPLAPHPPRETPLHEILRTGTLFESKSNRVRIWAKGDEGLMLTFPF